MRVSDALTSRMTCRAFLPTPVAGSAIRAILEDARHAPSGGNLQPWWVWAVAGSELGRLKAQVREKIAAGVWGDGEPEYAVFPSTLKEPYATRRFRNGETVFGAIGLERDDFAGRMAQTARNFEFFGAPAAYFFAIDREMAVGQWADLGMFLQSVMLSAREHGLHTAPLESWAYWHKTVRAFVGMPQELVLFCGMALGHMDETHPINQVRVGRAPVGEFARFMGCEGAGARYHGACATP
jgi:nitroreductase